MQNYTNTNVQFKDSKALSIKVSRTTKNNKTNKMRVRKLYLKIVIKY